MSAFIIFILRILKGKINIQRIVSIYNFQINLSIFSNCYFQNNYTTWSWAIFDFSRSKKKTPRLGVGVFSPEVYQSDFEINIFLTSPRG